jgi:hypothetical protein
MADSPREELARRIARYPKDALPFFQAGFATASKISEETIKLALKELIANLTIGKRRVDGSAIQHIIKLPEREADQLATALSLVVGLLSDSQGSAEDLISSGRGILFQPEFENVASILANVIVSNRAEIQHAVERAQLAGEVLPSLRLFEAVVDVRLRIADGAVGMFVPVALVHIDTDGRNHEIWLQLSRGEVEDTIKKLTACLEGMKVADSLNFTRK